MNKIYQDGFNAVPPDLKKYLANSKEGKAFFTNPYPLSSPEWQLWTEGWNDAVLRCRK